MPFVSRAADAGRLLLDFVTRDPAFVRGGPLDPSDIPVFTFHSLEADSFERRMRYLRDAGYQGIGMAEYLDVLTGRAPVRARSVLITIDDGRATTWTVGYPILKRLGMHATAFLVTSVVHDSAEVSKTIDTAGASGRDALIARDESSDRPFVTWGEVQAMRDVIDVESHTHWHGRIPVGPKVADVMTEGMRTGYGTFNCPFIWREGALVRGLAVPIGTPLPASAPRLSGRPGYRSVDQRYETEAEVRDAVRFDLAEARRLIRERAGADATTICYPWHVFSDLARRIAAEEGYSAGFAGKSEGPNAISRRGSDLFALARIGEGYVERLPGPNRKSLLSVLRGKLYRRP